LIPLLTVEKKLDPGSSKTSLEFFFKVPQRVGQITAHMTYDPVCLADRAHSQTLIQAAMRAYAPWEPLEDWERHMPLSNLITLSLDDPSGFRGNAHRKEGDQTHTLSSAQASPGFLPGPIAQGTWRAMVHIHALVTEGCSLKLTITGVEE
jgi:hypothetical protein